MSVLRYRCITWTLRKCLQKKLDRNYTRIRHAVLNRSWKQHPTKQSLYGHLPPIQGRRGTHAFHCWWSKDEIKNNVKKNQKLLRVDTPVLADRQKFTFISFVETHGAIYKPFPEHWSIGTERERERERERKRERERERIRVVASFDVDARGVMVIVAGIGHGDTSSNPGLIAFHIALIPLGKVWIQLFSLQLWVNSRADLVSLGEGKLWIQTS